MKTILSIDGGGVRGIVPLVCLAALEEREGRACREVFDMVAGTSTSAVIAAGISLGITAQELLDMYRQLAREAFQRIPLWKIIRNLGNPPLFQ